MRAVRLAAVGTLVAGALGAGMTGTASASPAVFEVGASVRDITPNATVAPPDGRVWLGGYGLGTLNNRKSTGVEKPIKVRAMVISNGTKTLAFGINETQGMFAKYQQGPYGLDDMRAEISAQTGIPTDHIVLGSNHTHQGPDTTFVWGGVPDTYLQYIKDQMVGAVVDAYNSRVPATLWVASENAPETYSGDTWVAPEQDIVDTTIRVLQAKRVSSDPALDGKTVVTFIEAPYHTTSGSNSSKTLINPSWAGDVSELAAAEFGGVGFGWQGDIGRQYGRGTGPIYTAAKRAIAKLAPISDSTIAGDVALLIEPVTNPLYIYFLTVARYVSPVTCAPPPGPLGTLCNPVARANTPPYGAGVVGGFYGTTFRIGNVLFAGGPGEVYPNIQQGLIDRVGADHHFYLGLAQDQIGYIIAPTTSWAAIVPQAGDNGLFNASPTVGDHLMCTHLASAASLGFTVGAVPDFCPALTATDPVGDQLEP